MSNNIQEDYCSFEVSKLLKEKGFAVFCGNSFNPTTNEEQRGICSDNIVVAALAQPTHSLAIKWIRENFGIYIWVEQTKLDLFKPFIKPIKGNSQNTTHWDFHRTPQEATEAALLYTLQNLIK